MQQSNLDKELFDKLHNLEADYSAGMWDKISYKLDNEVLEKSNSSQKRKWIAIFAIALLLISSVAFYFGYNTGKEKVQSQLQYNKNEGTTASIDNNTNRTEIISPSEQINSQSAVSKNTVNSNSHFNSNYTNTIAHSSSSVEMTDNHSNAVNSAVINTTNNQLNPSNTAKIEEFTAIKPFTVGAIHNKSIPYLQIGIAQNLGNSINLRTFDLKFRKEKFPFMLAFNFGSGFVDLLKDKTNFNSLANKNAEGMNKNQKIQSNIVNTNINFQLPVIPNMLNVYAGINYSAANTTRVFSAEERPVIDLVTNKIVGYLPLGTNEKNITTSEKNTNVAVNFGIKTKILKYKLVNIYLISGANFSLYNYTKGNMVDFANYTVSAIKNNQSKFQPELGACIEYPLLKHAVFQFNYTVRGYSQKYTYTEGIINNIEQKHLLNVGLNFKL